MLLFSCFVSPSVATMHVSTHVIKPHVLHNTRFSLKQGEKNILVAVIDSKYSLISKFSSLFTIRTGLKSFEYFIFLVKN